MAMRRGSNRGLNDLELAVIDANKLPVEEVADRPETLIINPEQLAWLMDHKAEFNAALATVKGMPADLFQFQTATKKKVVTDETLAAMAKLPKEKIKDVLPIVTTITVKPTMVEPEDISKTLGAVAKLVGYDPAKDLANKVVGDFVAEKQAKSK